MLVCSSVPLFVFVQKVMVVVALVFYSSTSIMTFFEFLIFQSFQVFSFWRERRRSKMASTAGFKITNYATVVITQNM